MFKFIKQSFITLSIFSGSLAGIAKVFTIKNVYQKTSNHA